MGSGEMCLLATLEVSEVRPQLRRSWVICQRNHQQRLCGTKMAMGYFLLAKLELSGQPAAEQWGRIGDDITLQSVWSLTGFAAAWKDFSAWLDNAIQISPSPTSFQTRCFKAKTFRGSLPPPHGLWLTQACYFPFCCSGSDSSRKKKAGMSGEVEDMQLLTQGRGVCV